MSDEAAFLNALKASPDDDVTRLVYADWLDEHEQPQKAEYLRLIAALAQREDGLADADEGKQLRALGAGLPEDWRTAAGSRFALVLVGYSPDQKITTIKWLREVTGDGLAEAKAASEHLPHSVHVCVPFELAWAVHERVPRPNVETRVVPHGPAVPQSGGPYTLFVRCWVSGPDGEGPQEVRARQDAERAAREALAALLARAHGLSAEEAQARAVLSSEIMLASGLTLQQVRTRQFALSHLIPPYRAQRNWMMWVRREPPNPASRDPGLCIFDTRRSVSARAPVK